MADCNHDEIYPLSLNDPARGSTFYYIARTPSPEKSTRTRYDWPDTNNSVELQEYKEGLREFEEHVRQERLEAKRIRQEKVNQDVEKVQNEHPALEASIKRANEEALAKLQKQEHKGAVGEFASEIPPPDFSKLGEKNFCAKHIAEVAVVREQWFSKHLEKGPPQPIDIPWPNKQALERKQAEIRESRERYPS